MEGIRQYLIAVSAAAIICGIAKSLADEKTAAGSVIRLIAGLVMTMTVLSPVVELDLRDLPALSGEIIAEASAAAAEGEKMAAAETNIIINEQMEAYILDKAADFGVELEVEFYMPDDGSLQPEGVTLRGTVSPYAKSQLRQIISQDLGIAKENQQWIG